jgi:amino acid transporter
MTPKAATLQSDDQDLIEAGYKPQLRRNLGFFASFAISFSFMSVLMGIFANYGYVLTKAGPFGLWTWLIVGFGQLLVALVFAEMAGRVPLTGALYNWNGRLGNPMVSWVVGWLTVFAYSAGSVGIVVAMIPPIQSFVGRNFGMSTISLIGAGILLLELLINVYGVRFAALINRVAVAAEILALVVFGIILASVVFLRGEANTALITTIPTVKGSYVPGFLMSTLLAAWTIFGFESPSDFAEETVNARRVAPKSIILSVLASALLGFFFIYIITMSIPDLARVTASSDPISTIFLARLGAMPTEVFLAFVIVAMFAASLMTTAAASRLLFAVSRDKRVLGHRWFATISGHGIPFYAAVLIAAVELVIFLTMYGLSALYSAAVVLLFLAYLITVVNFAIGLRKLPQGIRTFSLGRWHWPVVTLSIVWLVFEICVLTIPAEFHSAAMITVGICLFGLAFYYVQPALMKDSRNEISAD